MILPKDCEILWLNDSKQLSEKKREALYDEIMDKALAVGVGIETILYLMTIRKVHHFEGIGDETE